MTLIPVQPQLIIFSPLCTLKARDRYRLKKTDIGDGKTGNRRKRDRYRLKKTDKSEGETGNRRRTDRYRLMKTCLAEG